MYKMCITKLHVIVGLKMPSVSGIGSTYTHVVGWEQPLIPPASLVLMYISTKTLTY